MKRKKKKRFLMILKLFFSWTLRFGEKWILSTSWNKLAVYFKTKWPAEICISWSQDFNLSSCFHPCIRDLAISSQQKIPMKGGKFKIFLLSFVNSCRESESLYIMLLKAHVVLEFAALRMGHLQGKQQGLWQYFWARMHR